MSIFFNKTNIINELGVKGGAQLEDDENKNTDNPENQDDNTDNPPEDGENNDAPPEDNEGEENTDTPPDDPENNDVPPEDNEGDNNTDNPPEEGEDNDTNVLPDDNTSDNNTETPPEDGENNDMPPEDNEGEEGGEEPEGDESTDDGDMDNFDDDKEKTLSDIEDSIFSSLSPEQKAIKVVELKGSFVELFKACDDILEKINLIPKENSTIEVFEKITNTLLNLKTYIEYYISRTFDTKSYLENEVILQKYITIFNAVKETFKEISKRK